MGIRTKSLSVALAVLLSIAAALEPAAAYSTLKLSFSSNNKTISVAKGRSVLVTLDTTKWTVSKKSALSSMKVTAAQDFAATGCNVPGSGCGTTQFKFKLNKLGKAYLVAQRLSAGEAIRCVTDCVFKVTFKVR
jgi:hypothetical protein